MLHKELRGTDWANYSIEIVNHYPELLEKLAPRYARIKKSMDPNEEGSDVEKEHEWLDYLNFL